MTGKYDDIIDLPHHISKKRPHMSLQDRAAQFSPFAALTGYEEAIEETGRLTDSRTELGEFDTAVLDRKYRRLSELSPQQPAIIITRFVPDTRKSGGAYVTVTGRLKKIDTYLCSVILTDGTHIPFSDILSVESDALEE